MSLINSIPESKKASLRTISVTDLKVPVYLSEEVINSIRYLCRAIPREEWSGVIFYEAEGTIKNLKELTIRVKKLFPMHKGSAGYTEYYLNDPAFIDYRMENMEVNYMKMGHMHSHNSMNSFFSETDKSELVDNSEGYNYYLSIIVNNYMDVVAKIAYRAKTSFNNLQAKDEDGEGYSVNLTIEPEEFVVMVDCDVKLNNDIVAPDFIRIRTQEIIDTARKNTEKLSKFNSKDSMQTFNNFPSNIQGSENNNPKVEMSFNNKSELSKVDVNNKDDEDDVDLEMLTEMHGEYIDNLIKYILLEGNKVFVSKCELVDDAINVVVKSNKKKVQKYIERITKNFVRLHADYFAENNFEAPDIDDIMEDLEEIILILYDYEGDNIIHRLNQGLESLLEEIKIVSNQTNI